MGCPPERTDPSLPLTALMASLPGPAPQEELANRLWWETAALQGVQQGPEGGRQLGLLKS